MKFNKPLEEVFSARSSITVLRILNERNKGISGREISRLTSLSLRTVQIALANVEQTGILKRFIGNKEHLFVLNRENYFTKNLIEVIFKEEDNFRQNIFSEIRKKIGKEAISLIFFGSAARGTDTADSDLDICVVYEGNNKVLEGKVADLRSKLSGSFNVTLAPLYITVVKFREMYRKEKSPVKQIVKEGRLIAGKKIRALLNG